METIGPLRSRDQQINACVYWGTIKIEYDGSSNILYWGAHHEHNADTSWTDWVLKKFTNSSDGVTQIERQTSSWDNRATGWM